MYPFFHIFGRDIGAYVILSIIGALFTGIALYIINKNRAINKDQLLHIGLVSIVGLFIGAHLLYGITQLPNVLDVLINKREKLSTIKDYFYLFSQGFGGMVFYGGLFGGIFAAFVYCKALKLNIREYANALVPGIPLFHAFGRIGCFLSGCCYGIHSDWGFTYQNALIEEANHVQRFPVQLLEFLLELILFVLLTTLLIKFGNKFSLLRIYLFCYSIIRFSDEFLRGDVLRGVWGPFSTSQWISIIIFLFLIIEFLVKKYKKQVF